MSKIHYFPRYHTKENVITNNTLLLFSRLYEKSIDKFQLFIDNLIEDSKIPIGIEINQQTKKENSIPDGIIQQKAFKIVLETKRDNKFSIQQLIDHTKHFEKSGTNVLLALGKEKPINEKQLFAKILDYKKQNELDFDFFSITFEEIIKAFRNTIEEYDFELKNIIDDYEEFCESEKILPINKYILRSVLTGKSIKENLQFDIYYDTRNFNYQKYLGLYSNKSIIAIGKVNKIVQADVNNEEIIVKNNVDLTSSEEERLKGIVQEAYNSKGWNINKNHNFYFVDKFYKTDFRKNTKYAPQGTKLFDIEKMLNGIDLENTELIAKTLEGKIWEEYHN